MSDISIRDGNNELAGLDMGRMALAVAKDNEGRFWVRNQAQAARAAGVVLGRRDVVRVAQLLINDAESAIAEANPTEQGKRTDLIYCKYCYKNVKELGGECDECGARLKPEGLPNPQLGSASQREIYGQMRTAAAVWAGQREEVEADPNSIVPTRAALIREARKNRQTEAAKLKIHPLPTAVGRYATVVIDPPWPMEKIDRAVRQSQSGFDYPTMSLEDIAALPIPSLLADDAWVLLWTTQKFLPSCFGLLEAWGLGYRWTMVWHKPGGYQAYNYPQFNGEFVVVGAKGNPKLLDAKAFNAVFEAPRGAHSEKPQAFYDLVGRTLGQGLDMFARQAREGWTGWGDEV